jgi:hypothetical protein
MNGRLNDDSLRRRVLMAKKLKESEIEAAESADQVRVQTVH